MLDANIFSRIKTKQDFDREREEFEVRKRQQMMQEQLGQQQLQLGGVQIDQARKDLEMGVNRNDPAAVREYNFFSQLPPEEQERYLGMKRAQQTLNLGGTQAVLNPMGGIQQQYTVTPKISEMPDFQAQQAGAQEQAKLQQQLALEPKIKSAVQTAQTTSEAAQMLPQLQQQSQMMKDTILKLIDEQGNLRPGVGEIAGGIFGMQGRQASAFPVTEAQRKYQPVVNQIKGQTFLEAYERLKGGGVITEIEGAKAEQALARLDQAQSDEDFAGALKDLYDVIQSGEQRALQQAGMAQPQDPMQASRSAIIGQQQQIGVNPSQREDLNPQQIEESLFNARKAIKAGRDPELIRQRLLENGIDPSKAGL
jgi:hypothetical protein